MKNEKKYPKKQLEKYSVVFIQLGLVLSLFVVFQLIEYTTTSKYYVVNVTPPLIDLTVLDHETPLVYSKEKIVPLIKKQPSPALLDLLKVDEKKVVSNLQEIENPLDSEPFDIDKVLENYTEDEVDPQIEDEVAFIRIEDAPIYKGCESLVKESQKKCFVSSIQKFVVRRFDVDLAQDLGLMSGRYKIFAQFIITKTGEVSDVKIKAPHHKLKKEVRKILFRLPQFTPGMQRKVPVNVRFTLPIVFRVE